MSLLSVRLVFYTMLTHMVYIRLMLNFLHQNNLFHNIFDLALKSFKIFYELRQSENEALDIVDIVSSMFD